MLRCWATLKTALLYMKTRITAIDWFDLAYKVVLMLVLAGMILLIWGAVFLVLFLYKLVALLAV